MHGRTNKRIPTLGKPNSIRKRALDFARKRQWDKALVEFEKLVEIESHNPNLFNELGDLHIKLDNKREAFKSFHKAVDAYTKVGLHNNAVAVCKKIIRLNPGDHVVYGKLARLRHRCLDLRLSLYTASKMGIHWQI